MTVKQRIKALEKNLTTVLDKKEIEKLGGQLFFNDNTKRQEVLYVIYSDTDKLTAKEKATIEKLEKLCSKHGYHFEFLHFIDDIPEND